jgi:membrane-associated protease RseP (regulator of RpoE activity)
MGHFLMTLRYRIPASLPYFIPFPISPLGTMGAVIAMAGYRADRRQTFDIGIAGPLAGLVIAVPILLFGVKTLDLSQTGYGSFAVDCPLLMRLVIRWLKPEHAHVTQIWVSQMNPFFMAAWVGLLITGLNMAPISQLDGGHVTYTLFGKSAHWIARGFLIFVLLYIVIARAYVWTLMVVLVTLIGTDHPPTGNDHMPLGRGRYLLGLVSLAIPVLCFPPRLIVQLF